MPQTTGYLWTFAKTDITTTPSQLETTGSYRAAHGVWIKAPSTNADYVLIGNKEYREYILYAGEEIMIPIDDPSQIYVEAASGTLVVLVMIV